MPAPANLRLPEATEVVPCNLCGGDNVLLLSERGRFGLPVRNVVCVRCGLIWVRPRPTADEMARYYAEDYRAHYGSVRQPDRNGKLVAPGDPGWEAHLDHQAGVQAHNAGAGAGLGPGRRVLEVGSKDGRTLAAMRHRWGVEVQGVEPDDEQAGFAEARDVPTFTGVVEDFSPGDVRYDLIMLFQVLEHLHEPLATLVRLSSWLAPGGRLVVEVPNADQPYGRLEADFLQNAHLHTFRPNTLVALFRRAGLRTTAVHNHEALQVNGVVAGPPVPFADHLLPDPTDGGAAVHGRLTAWRDLTVLRLLLGRGALDMNLLEALLATVAKPMPANQVQRLVPDIAELFLKRGSPKLARTVLLATARGPHPPAVQRMCLQAARALSP